MFYFQQLGSPLNDPNSTSPGKSYFGLCVFVNAVVFIRCSLPQSLVFPYVVKWPAHSEFDTRTEAADEVGAAGGGKEDDMVHSVKMGGALKILERMVNQNAEDEIFQDFKYWEVG